MINVLAVENYRSLRHLVVPLSGITVVTGANGSGKSSLYRALRLLAECARGGAVAALAAEGGLPSTLWAGPEHPGRGPVQGTVRDGPVGLRLGFAADDFGYAVDLGPPPPTRSAFALDPQIKVEAVWAGPFLRPAALLAERNGPRIKVRDGRGWAVLDHRPAPFDSMIGELADPRHAPELLELRERIRSWRFYDHLRTDAGAPARGSHIATRTPVLGHDGADLAAALQTIIEIGDHTTLETVIDKAFPGSRLKVVADGPARLAVELRQPGLLRSLGAAELSDGTLRYLLWAAALLTPRPPELFVCNEPETSLHPELIGPLAELIAAASAHTQVVVVSHSAPLVAALEEVGAGTVELRKEGGRTIVEGEGPLDGPPWYWPKR
ncbi:AAA family ATPase [Phytomonospora endophytica]|uniref:Putative ATPase n=1 Tax=Phytomonospora endophytica TaxID=714109 RepID=A0A841FJI0_9ACTN|nr:AAA family ATPase [Phytomonospora endophytica]MBB6036034.1 putative ATPase [Phytomonospora endophytica]